MVFRKDNQVIVKCDCNCGNSLVFVKDFNLIWVSGLSGNFYTMSIYGILKTKLNNVPNMINKKPSYYNGIVIKENDLIELISELEDLIKDLPDRYIDDSLEPIEERPQLNLYFDKTIYDLPDMEREYSLRIRNKFTLKDLVYDHEHRGYETEFTKEEMRRFLNKAREYIKYAQKGDSY